jgi:aldehyde:ferredoxin oxidoreductase
MTNLMGARAEDDRMPPNSLIPLEASMSAGSVPDMDLMLKEYYALRGLDTDGVPSREALEKAGLTLLSEKLHAGK